MRSQPLSCFVLGHHCIDVVHILTSAAPPLQQEPQLTTYYTTDISARMPQNPDETSFAVARDVVSTSSWYQDSNLWILDDLNVLVIFVMRVPQTSQVKTM
jgi:hypothetical protein